MATLVGPSLFGITSGAAAPELYGSILKTVPAALPCDPPFIVVP
jgi:hypothetical protein